MYDLETGKVQLWRGQPAKRPDGAPPPCESACPKGKPFFYADLLPQNAEALQHFQQCAAVGHFPDDPIVAKNAAILRQVERAIERGQRREDFLINSIRTALPTLQPRPRR
jgi:hypothetical protein